MINEDARVTKGYAASQIQRCYAVKAGVNGLLDVARRSHSDIINSISGNSFYYIFTYKFATGLMPVCTC